MLQAICFSVPSFHYLYKLKTPVYELGPGVNLPELGCVCVLNWLINGLDIRSILLLTKAR